jgi:hypothetical protein
MPQDFMAVDESSSRSSSKQMVYTPERTTHMEQHGEHVSGEHTDTMRQQFKEIQINLAEHTAKIQKHCDEVHTHVAERSNADPEYAQLLRIPNMQMDVVVGDEIAMVEHLSAMLERIAILETYIKAHGGLIVNLSMSTGAASDMDYQ